MEKASIILTFVAIAIGLVAFVFVIILNIRQAQYAYKVLYEDLVTFKYFVEECSVSTQNRDIILKRIKTERARNEFEEPEYGNLVNAIAQTYIKRFFEVSGGTKILR